MPAKSLFWFSSLAIMHSWCGYIALLAIVALRKGKAIPHSDVYPIVTVVIAAYNEEEVIEKRVQNILGADYPRHALDILVVSDGSSDRTEDILRAMGETEKRLQVLRTERLGKTGAQCKAIPHARGEIIVLTDAGTMFENDTIKNIVRRFADDRIGCVGGKLVLPKGSSSISQSQGLYWKYEMLLRNLESRCGNLHKVSGGIMAFRKKLFRPFSAAYGDDCFIPLDTILQGYKIAHEDTAIAYDSFPSSVKGEMKARARMTLRNITCTFSKSEILNPFKFPVMSFSIISHRILRWLTPYFMIAAFITNAFLLGDGLIYQAAFVSQVVFYLFGLAGLAANSRGSKLPVASQVFSFLLANKGFFQGVNMAIAGQKITRYNQQG